MQGLHSESLGRVACVVHLELLGLRLLCISTIGTGTINCNEPKNYPRKRCTLESPMQGLHSESLWTGMLCGATTPYVTQSYIRTSSLRRNT